MNQEMDALLRKFTSIVEKAVEQLREEMKTGFATLQERLDKLQDENRHLKIENKAIKTEMDKLQQRVKVQEETMERFRKHSYSYDVLLHGVPEDTNENADSLATTVTNFIKGKVPAKYMADVEMYVHRLGPKKLTLPSPDGTTADVRPRPLIFRMKSRSSQSVLVATLSKRNVKDGPYLSSHYTPRQIEEFKNKHSAKAGTKRAGENHDNAPKVRQSRPNTTTM